MKVAINTSGAVAGGAITHLRNLMPHLVDELAGAEIVMIGSEASRAAISGGPEVPWHEVETGAGRLIDRVRFENAVLPTLLEELGADVLFHPANFCAFRARIPQVILIHNLAPFLEEVIDEESVAQKLRLALLRRLTLYSLKKASRTIFISSWGRDLVAAGRRFDPDRMPIVPFGAEHGAHGSTSDVLMRLGVESGRFALTVSHLYRYKKVEKLVEAWGRLRKDLRRMPLIVVGEPFDRSYAAHLEELAQRKQLPVVFVGAMGASDLATLMQECRIFLFSSEAENLPITLLEAMSAGCPIVTNRACSMPEVCSDAVIYADPPTPERYTAEISRLLGDDVLVRNLKERALRRASKFTWSEAAKRTAEILRDAATDG